MGRRLRIVLVIAVGLSLALVGAGWWWATSERAPDDRPRVGAERRPAWARRFRVPGPERPPVPITPPASMAPLAELESDDALDTDVLAEIGQGVISGWLVDSRGADVGRGRVRLSCLLPDLDDPETLSRRNSNELAVGDDGFFEFLVDAPADCTVIGRRLDGLLFAYSKPVEVYVEPGELFETDLIVPAARTGGLGVAISEHPDGVLIQRVHDGTPAARAGLESGDVIVEVDGKASADLGLQEFIRQTTGAEGTDVEVVVMRADGFEQSHLIRRQYLDRSLIR